MVAVSPGFPVLISKGFLGFPWVSRVSWGHPGFPEVARNQHGYENIAFDFGGSGFPAGELALFKIKKGYDVSGANAVCSKQCRLMPCLELEGHWCFCFLKPFSRILWAHVALFFKAMRVCCQEAMKSSRAASTLRAAKGLI